MNARISLNVGDLDRSRDFSDQALAPLGVRRTIEVDDAQDCCASGYGVTEGEPAFRIDVGAEETCEMVSPPAAGGLDSGLTSPRPTYSPDHYAAFIIDPDGRHIEAVCHKPE